MARHRSPRSRGARRESPPSGAILAAGAGGAHRVSVGASPGVSALASRRGLLAAGGATVLLGQAALFHVVDPARPLLPDLVDVFDSHTQETTTTVPAASVTEPAVGMIEPVRPAPVEELGRADVASLTKAAGLAEAARAAEEATRKAAAAAAAAAADKPSVRGAGCAANSAGFGAVKAFVGDAGHWLRCIFGVQTVGGVGGRSGTSDHPSGLALDFMVGKATGDQLADYALKYRNELKIKYVIWRQRINFGSGWQSMEDRGSATANHYDHVHVSFEA